MGKEGLVIACSLNNYFSQYQPGIAIHNVCKRLDQRRDCSFVCADCIHQQRDGQLTWRRSRHQRMLSGKVQLHEPQYSAVLGFTGSLIGTCRLLMVSSFSVRQRVTENTTRLEYTKQYPWGSHWKDKTVPLGVPNRNTTSLNHERITLNTYLATGKTTVATTTIITTRTKDRKETMFFLQSNNRNKNNCW